MTRNHFGLACAAICLFPLIVRADRPPDDRAEVPVVVIGRVVAISESWDLEHDYYRVQIRVEEVDRGQSIAAGEVIEVAIYRWSRPWPGSRASACGNCRSGWPEAVAGSALLQRRASSRITSFSRRIWKRERKLLPSST